MVAAIQLEPIVTVWEYVKAHYCQIFDVSKETRKSNYLCEISRFSSARNAFQILYTHLWARLSDDLQFTSLASVPCPDKP